VPSFNFSPLDNALRTLHQAATEYDDAFAAASEDGSLFRKSRADLSSPNRLLVQSERKMLLEAGLPRRSWFEHAFLRARVLYRLRREDTARVREATEAGNWTEAADEEKALVTVIGNLTAQIRNARARLR
jgi:N-acetylated-alpha-linked acidic dipeptidase